MYTSYIYKNQLQVAVVQNSSKSQTILFLKTDLLKFCSSPSIQVTASFNNFFWLLCSILTFLSRAQWFEILSPFLLWNHLVKFCLKFFSFKSSLKNLSLFYSHLRKKIFIPILLKIWVKTAYSRSHTIYVSVFPFQHFRNFYHTIQSHSVVF